MAGPGYNFRNPRDVLELIAEKRRTHSATRSEIAARIILGLNYDLGRHWNVVSQGAGTAPPVDVWDEDWEIGSKEMRITDNKIGPLVRRIAASTNATAIEASVSPKRHVKGVGASALASVSEDVLNGIEQDAGMTRAARNASSFRWKTGNAIMFITMNNRPSQTDAVYGEDGRPMRVNDRWLRWEYLPLTDLIWDVGNLCEDLEDHECLILERIITCKKFEREFGPIEDYGFIKDDLPTIQDLAPFYTAAAAMNTQVSLFRSYSNNSSEKAVRVCTLMIADVGDPGRWTKQFHCVDGSMANSYDDALKGTVINFDNPVSPYGAHGRSVFKLDAYRTGESMWSHGVPHILIQPQDTLNILRSIQFQQLTAIVYGMWLVDERTADTDEFINSLNKSVGGVLKWNSKDGSLKPPQLVTPPLMDQTGVLIGSDISIGMRDAVHVSALQLGVGKSHVDQRTQQSLLQESNVVPDMVAQRDAETYSDMLRVTLGTVRKILDQPGRMLQRLAADHGFTQQDLQTFYELDPATVPFDVLVRQDSIRRRSVDERKAQLVEAVTLQAITPDDYITAMADELEMPVREIDMRQLDWIRIAVRDIVDGDDWDGMPDLEFPMFRSVARRAMFALDRKNPVEMAAIARLQTAIVNQQQIALEQSQANAMVTDPGSPEAQMPQPMQSQMFPADRTGAPESINPLTFPANAAGALSAGIA
jgi:hypothetical protein